jgi:aminoacyl tRNA synthase complex-interacting multifunctional protein 1
MDATHVCRYGSKGSPHNVFTGTMANALDLLDATIAELEARLSLKPGEEIKGSGKASAADGTAHTATTDRKKSNVKAAPAVEPSNAAADDLPDICKLEFKVGVITKVWVHETADKLYCEEIDIGEEEGPRQIASGLRAHFSLEQMMGQRLLVVSNLKAKNLVGFKSHGMVLCAAEALPDGQERVEFVEPPADAAIGQVVTFDGLPAPQPLPPNQVEKKKVFAACCPGMKTTSECVAVWNGHAFMTTEGPCKTRSIANGVLR